MCAVRGAERVHDEDVAQGRHLPCQRIVASFLAAQETHILEQYDLARSDVDSIDPVADQRHVATKQDAETIGNGLQ